MKTISLWQPWATLVMVGAKQIETRSWRTPYRGALLIHASQKTSRELIELCHEEPFRTALHAAGFTRWQQLPRGVVLGSVQLVDCRLIADIERVPEPLDDRPGCSMLPPVYPESAFGDYAPGRFGWRLADPSPFSTPIPARGRQQLFDIPPEELGLR